MAERVRGSIPDQFKVWIDFERIHPGDSISTVLQNALTGSDYYVLLISENSISSKWVRQEITFAFELADRKKLSVIPVLKVSSPDDLDYYALFQCTADDDGIPLAGTVDHAYWFSSRELKTGDLVILYSKGGVRSEKKNDNGSTSYFFYWGLPESFWTSKKVAVLVSTTEWETGQPIK
jgi:hypothetical protein